MSQNPPQIDMVRKQVIELKTSLLQQDPNALARIQATHPDLRYATVETFPMDLAYWYSARTIAREFGFVNYFHLTRHLAKGGQLPVEGALEALIDAVELPDPNTVREILSSYPHFATARIWDNNNPLGDTLLHRADANAPQAAPWGDRDQTTEDHLEVARALIEHGASVNASGGKGDTIGQTPIGGAGWAGNLRMVELLLQNGADPTLITHDWGYDALSTIAGHGHSNIVESIIEAGWPVEPRHLVQANLLDRLRTVLDEEPERVHEPVDMGHFDGNSGTLLHTAVNENKPEVVSLLLERDAEVNALDSCGRTPLQLISSDSNRVIPDTLINAAANVGILEAVAIGHLNQTKELLDSDPKLINERRLDGMSLLHIAITSGRNELIPLLIERGADPKARNVAGETLLQVMTRPAQLPVAKMLIDAGAEPTPEALIGLGMLDELKALLREDSDFVNRLMPLSGRSPAFAAVVSQQLEVLELLLAFGASPNEDGFIFSTPIGAVAGLPKERSAAFTEVLVKVGLNPDVVSWRTPLGHLVTTEHYAAADVLLNNGADIELRNTGGQTPLQDLIKAPEESERQDHFMSQMNFLLDRGANVNSLSSQGETALDRAIRLGNEIQATFLRERDGTSAEELLTIRFEPPELL